MKNDKPAYLFEQVVYGPNGEKYQYLGPVPFGNHVVKPFLIDQETGDEYPGDPIVLDFIPLEQPPLPAIEERCDAFRKQTEEYRKQMDGLEDEVSRLEREHAALLKRLKAHKALQGIDDFVSGKITHFWVEPDYRAPNVVEAKDALYTKEDYRCKQKLLTLFGASNGDLQWQINQYSDGSSSTKLLAFPFTSKEDAVAFGISRIKERIAAWNEAKPDWYLEEWAESAVKFGIEVPARIMTFLKEKELRTWRDKLAEKESEANSIRIKIEKLEGKQE